MSIPMENAETCFKRLLRESKSKKFKTSLEHIKEACDNIINMRGLLNYARVGKYTTDHFGGPKGQSISNNDNLRLYIGLRIEEYERQSKSPKPTKNKEPLPPFPTGNLDLKTRSHIKQLESQVTFQENIIRNLEKDIVQKTLENPIDYDKSISAGARADLSMHISRKSEVNEESEQLKMINNVVQRLLDIAKDPCSPLDIKTRDEKKYLSLQYGQIIATVLYSNELSEFNPLKR